MRKDYSSLSSNIRSRLNPDNVLLEKSFTDGLSGIDYNDVRSFIQFAMKGVEPEYTQKSKDAGEKVKLHLKSTLEDVEYRYQGSVMTNTHIRGYSDIDLLTISSKFYSYDARWVKEYLDNPTRRQELNPASLTKLERELNACSYSGDALHDLRQIRLDSEIVLSDIYLDCDLTKPKAIRIKNRSLNRDVDVVTANWHDDLRSIIWDKGNNRGIQVYNKKKHSKGTPSFPFRSIDMINERSSDTNGRLKKMIRFTKNCKCESSTDIDLSSFDINAICYDIEIKDFINSSIYELVEVLYKQFSRIVENNSIADGITSVDGSEYIFRNKPEKKRALIELKNEIALIYLDLYENQQHLLAG